MVYLLEMVIFHSYMAVYYRIMIILLPTDFAFHDPNRFSYCPWATRYEGTAGWPGFRQQVPQGSPRPNSLRPKIDLNHQRWGKKT